MERLQALGFRALGFRELLDKGPIIWAYLDRESSSGCHEESCSIRLLTRITYENSGGGAGSHGRDGNAAMVGATSAVGFGAVGF